MWRGWLQFLPPSLPYLSLSIYDLYLSVVGCKARECLMARGWRCSPWADDLIWITAAHLYPPKSILQISRLQRRNPRRHANVGHSCASITPTLITFYIPLWYAAWFWPYTDPMNVSPVQCQRWRQQCRSVTNHLHQQGLCFRRNRCVRSCRWEGAGFYATDLIELLLFKAKWFIYGLLMTQGDYSSTHPPIGHHLWTP